MALFDYTDYSGELPQYLGKRHSTVKTQHIYSTAIDKLPTNKKVL